MASLAEPSPVRQNFHSYLLASEDDDGDTASQRSISLSSPAVSPRNSAHGGVFSLDSHVSGDLSKRASQPYTLDTDFSSEADDVSLYTHDMGTHESPNTSAAPSVLEEPKEPHFVPGLPTYPPSVPRATDTESVTSFASGSSRKARPESMLVIPSAGPLVLGIALVDFNHLVRRVQYALSYW